MSKYILDTDVCIEFLRGNSKIMKRIFEVGRDYCAISEISVAELLLGLEKARLNGYKNQDVSVIESSFETIPLRPVFPFFAKNRAYLESIGKRIEDFDLLIASTAQYCDAILVTGNKKHMGHVEGIEIEDWIRGECKDVARPRLGERYEFHKLS